MLIVNAMEGSMHAISPRTMKTSRRNSACKYVNCQGFIAAELIVSSKESQFSPVDTWFQE